MHEVFVKTFEQEKTVLQAGKKNWISFVNAE